MLPVQPMILLAGNDSDSTYTTVTTDNVYSVDQSADDIDSRATGQISSSNAADENATYIEQ